MKVNKLAKKTGLTVLTMPYPEKEVTDGYAGDMPSWVMGRGKAGSVWITIMNNENIVAVASLLELSCIVVSDGSKVPENVIKIAEREGINLFSSKKSTFHLAAEIAGLI